MNKLKLFLENFLIYGIGGIFSKIIPLIMVPIVTRIMPDSSYYGISDLSNTIVSFGSAIAVMGMYDAMYRMFFERDDEEFKKDICSTSLIFTLGTSLFVFVVMLLLKNIISEAVFKDDRLNYLVYITAIATLVGATNSIVAAPTRMQNKRKTFIVMNTVSPLLSYSISIPLLLNGYYIIALPLAGAISSLTSEIIFCGLNRKWFELKRFHPEYLKPLLKIAVPLMPGVLIYWIFNSCDKLMIANFMDTGATGIYSVASKLGHCSQLIYTAFAGGWQFFAFSTMKDANQVKSNSLVFEYLGVIAFGCSVFVFALSKLIFQILFPTEYLEGYAAAPFLFLAPLMQMLYQVAANQFLVIKKTYPNLLILTCGAIINIILNFLLIPRMGIEGAAIATLAGYVVSVVICTIVLYRMKLMIISMRFLTAWAAMITYIILWRILFSYKIFIGTLAALIISCLFIFIYKKDIAKLFNNIKSEV